MTAHDGDEWVVVARAHGHAAAKAAALDRLAALGILAGPQSDVEGMDLAGIDDDDIRIDVICGREPADTSTRISIRKSVLDQASSTSPADLDIT